MTQWVEFLFEVKFVFSKKATKIDEIFTFDLTLCSKYQIDGEDFANFGAFLENTSFNFNAFDIETFKVMHKVI